MEGSLTLSGSTPQAASAAIRSVSVKSVSAEIDEAGAQAVLIAARGNLRGVPGTFSRRGTNLSRRKHRVTISGVLAVVAEYGMLGRGWYVFGRRKGGSPVPPPRAVSGRPKPEDGYVIGQAWKMWRGRFTKGAADRMLDEYSIAFDKHGVKKGRGV